MYVYEDPLNMLLSIFTSPLWSGIEDHNISITNVNFDNLGITNACNGNNLSSICAPPPWSNVEDRHIGLTKVHYENHGSIQMPLHNLL